MCFSEKLFSTVETGPGDGYWGGSIVRDRSLIFLKRMSVEGLFFFMVSFCRAAVSAWLKGYRQFHLPFFFGEKCVKNAPNKTYCLSKAVF
jgi:hypothetical protein